MKARSRLRNGRFKRTNYFTKTYFHYLTIWIVFFLFVPAAIVVDYGTPDVPIATAKGPEVVIAAPAEPPATDADSPVPTAAPEPAIEPDDMSVYISQAVQEFLPDHKSESLMIMHCLAHRENGHAGNPNAHGDHGLAGGPYQFHESTWQRMRKQMIAEGVATEIGSRYDKKESTRTTAWAIANGRAREWGPILRDSKGSNFAACQMPSWY